MLQQLYNYLFSKETVKKINKNKIQLHRFNNFTLKKIFIDYLSNHYVIIYPSLTKKLIPIINYNKVVIEKTNI